MNAKRMWCLSAVGVLIVALSGCGTTKPVVSKPVVSKPAVNVGLVTASDQSVSASEKIRSIRAYSSVVADDDEWKETAKSVERVVDDELAQNGLSVIGDCDSAEIVVTGRVALNDKTQRGDRLVLKGSADLTMTRRMMSSAFARNAKVGGLVSNGSFAAKSEEAYSAFEALRGLGKALEPDARSWVRSACAKVASGIGVCDISFVGLKGRQTAQEGFPSWFAAKLNDMDGIYECRVTASESNPSKMTATVVYEKRLFPDGVLSRLRALKIVKTTDGAK